MIREKTSAFCSHDFSKLSHSRQLHNLKFVENINHLVFLKLGLCLHLNVVHILSRTKLYDHRKCTQFPKTE